MEESPVKNTSDIPTTTSQTIPLSELDGSNVDASYSEEELLFVYGTLMRGGPMHGHLCLKGRDVQFISTARVSGILYDATHFPVLRLIPGRLIVQGELFSFPKSRNICEKYLDGIEGVGGGLYDRVEAVVVMPTGLRVRAWTYVGHGNWYMKYPMLVDGCWKNSRT